MTSLYFIGEEDGGPVKIGISREITKRLSQIQNGNPRSLSVEALIEIPEGVEPFALEAAVHGIFAGTRMRGEWFRRTPLLDYTKQQMADQGLQEWLAGWETWAGTPFLPCPASS